MKERLPREIRQRLCALPLLERLHVLARASSAPLGELIGHVPSGRLLDLGCGHGLLTAWVAAKRPDVQVLGLDPDPRKVAWARQLLAGVPNARLEEGAIEDLRDSSVEAFDCVALVDVLYLIPRPRWPTLLAQIHALLRPGGLLLLKEVEGDRSWRHYKGLAQEWAMVHLFRRTHTSGAITLETRAGLARLLEQARFRVEVEKDLRRGFTTAHLLHVARAY